jgi:spermidine synthase
MELPETRGASIIRPDMKLAETTTPDGGRLILYEHDGSFCIRLNGLQLMNSAAVDSELLLAEVAAEGLAGASAPRLLIGGLGLGFTLKGVLQAVGPNATIHVAELIPQIVDWNRQFVSRLNGALLEDPRVQVHVKDVWKLITCTEPAYYDAMLFDVDNGPTAMVQQENARLYSARGLEQMAAVLKAGGRAVFWSADLVPEFSARLMEAGFSVKTVPVRFCATDQECAGAIYVADKRRQA